MIETHADLPTEVAHVLAWWWPRVRALLGDNLVGARLTGSAVLGGFEPRWSDVDLCVLLREPVTADQARRIGRLHAEMEQRFLSSQEWHATQLAEGPYMPADLASRRAAPGHHLMIGTGTCCVDDGDPVPGFHRYVLAHHSIAIGGPAPEFALPSRDDLVAGHQWLLDLLARTPDAHSPIMLAGLVQEAARALLFWEEGTYVGKNAALDWAVENVPDLAQACAIARRARLAGSARAQEYRGDLEPAYERAAPVALKRLRRHLDGDVQARGPART